MRPRESPPAAVKTVREKPSVRSCTLVPSAYNYERLTFVLMGPRHRRYAIPRGS